MWRALLVVWAIPLVLLVSPSGSVYARQVGDAGEVLYAEQCSACHGPDGAGTRAGPSLLALLQTEESESGVARIVRDGYGEMSGADDLSPAEVESVSRFVVSRFGTSGNVSGGELLYGSLCADCHGRQAEGGSALGLGGVPSPMIVSAIRSGRVGMPAYDDSQLTDSEVASIAEYVVRASPPASSGGGGGIALLDWSLRALHVVAVVIYLGGGILFHGSLRAALHQIPPGQASMVGTRVGRDFTYLSWISLGLWGATGYWMLFRYGWGDASAPLTLFIDPDRLDTARGVALLVMLSVWFLIVVFASIITFVLRPRLSQRVTPDADSETAGRVANTIADASRWIDILARTNFVLTIVGLASGAPFL